MMESGKPRKRRQLSPEEKWEVFLEVASQQLTQADAARKWGVDVSTVIRIRELAKDAALAAFAASKPGRMPSPEQVELEAALAENDRLSEALKELAVELSLHRGRQRSGFRPGPAARERGDQARADGPRRRRRSGGLGARACVSGA
jgi:transposase